MKMSWFHLVVILAIQLCASTRILYVLPDNSTNATCLFQPCATLSEYLLDNGTLPVVSNVQYYFLPGEHHVPVNMLLQDLCNFSIIGTVKELPPPVVLVGCLQSYVINVINSYNVTIANVVFKQCDQTQLNKYIYLTNMLINLCYSCTIENVIFMNLGLKIENLNGNSHLSKIVIMSDATQPNYLVFCQGITLYYWDKPAFKHLLIINQVKIIGQKTSNKDNGKTISGIIFYANVASINDSVLLVNDNVFKPLQVFVSFLNLDLGIETCFYNGMDSYTKTWLQLFFLFYLLVIAASIIIASRYSSKILRLTYSRSLPVLATLFLLSYTGVLRVVLTVLFSYSTITHLPSGHQQIVWSIDASVPLFGITFIILFIACLALFLLLIPLNITLLFTRYLWIFRVINYYKPLLDAFQGSYKEILLLGWITGNHEKFIFCHVCISNKT